GRLRRARRTRGTARRPAPRRCRDRPLRAGTDAPGREGAGRGPSRRYHRRGRAHHAGVGVTVVPPESSATVHGESLLGTIRHLCIVVRSDVPELGSVLDDLIRTATARGLTVAVEGHAHPHAPPGTEIFEAGEGPPP